jgi:hypothetical protein
MSNLLETVIEAHGGLERWSELDAVSARLVQGGALWALKGQQGVLDDVFVRASLHQERESHHPFGAPDRRSAFTPEQTLYVGSDGLFRRHDYDVEISGGTAGAHYISDYTKVAGIMIPAKHRIFPRSPDGQALGEPLIVSIELSEITFT